jgi:hypothetical protein
MIEVIDMLPKPEIQQKANELLTKVGIVGEIPVPKEGRLKDNVARRGARKWFQACLLALLSFEIFFIAYLILSQAIKRLLFTSIEFSLSEWEFAPFINVALIQTCILISPIAKDRFPGKVKNYN